MKKILVLFTIFIWIFYFTNKLTANTSSESFLLKKISAVINEKTSDKYKQLELLWEIQKVWKKYNNESLNKTLTSLNNILKSQINNDENKVKEIIIWKTRTWNEIKAYYRWNPHNSFLLFVANIHWWYEYGTYKTAKLLKEKLISENKKWWMIIETLNPDWLEYYLNNQEEEKYYLEWRANSNWIDLNRNFCTKSFSNFNYTRWEIELKTWEFCESELEVQAISNLLKNYSFSWLIDIHSAWWTIFIPENSFDDKNVINFASKIQSLLWDDYIFEADYKNQHQKERLIEFFEIDSWGDWEFTWTLITYFYEQTGFPAVLIELTKHWEIEEKVLNLVEVVE
jgi:hypothetical protein